MVRKLSTDLTAAPEPASRLTELMRHHQLRVYRYLVALVGDRHLAEECTQETFVRAFDHLEGGHPVTSAWLFRVARSRGIDELRRRGRQVTEAALHDSVAVHDGSDVEVRQALAALPPDDRSLLYLVAVESFGAQEIADLLGISRAAAYTRISRARQRLRALLEEPHETS